MKKIWRTIAVAALRALRPHVRMSAEQSMYWQAVIDMLETI